MRTGDHDPHNPKIQGMHTSRMSRKTPFSRFPMTTASIILTIIFFLLLSQSKCSAQICTNVIDVAPPISIDNNSTAPLFFSLGTSVPYYFNLNVSASQTQPDPSEILMHWNAAPGGWSGSALQSYTVLPYGM